MKEILVIAEHQHGQLKPATLSAITAASRLGGVVDILVAGHSCEKIVDALTTVSGLRQILVADEECYEHALAETWAPLIVSLQENYSHWVMAATTLGKNIMPRVAALLNVAPLSDVIEILENQTYRRPIYAGNVIATVKSHDVMQVLTIRTTAFAPAELGNNKCPPHIKIINFKVNNTQSRFVAEELHTSDRPELQGAEIVISGGRGLQTAENFSRLIKIAERMGAAIGASRAAVDAGLAPNDFQVGQTGQIVAPKLYIAVGISGAIQHVAGMKDSKIVVAINKDPEAPIFQIANYGLVGDINEILTDWENLL